MKFHLPSEENPNISPSVHRRVIHSVLDTFRRNVRRNHHVLNLLTWVVVHNAKRLQHDRVSHNFRHAISHRHVLLRKTKQKQVILRNQRAKLLGEKNKRRTYQRVEARAEIMRGDENMVGAPAPVPERVLRGDEVDCGRDERARVANRGKAIDGAEVARDVNGYEEKVSFVRVKRAHLAGQQSPVNGNLRRKQMLTTPLVR